MLYVRDFTDDERAILTKNGKKRSFLGAKCRTLLGAGQHHLCAAQAARIRRERELRLRRNELARPYHWKRHKRLAPLNINKRQI